MTQLCHQPLGQCAEYVAEQCPGMPDTGEKHCVMRRCSERQQPACEVCRLAVENKAAMRRAALAVDR